MYQNVIDSDLQDGIDSKDLAKNLEHWMTELPQQLRRVPIIYLAIPGSHDSFTVDITMNSKVAPDAEKILQKLQCLLCLRYIMARWSKTQSYSASEQLRSGIRFFDLRIATKEREDNLYFVHGLYSDEVQTVLDDIVSFLETHPQEVITVYRSDEARFGQPLLWPSANFPNPWPNTYNQTDLFNDLDSGLKSRSLSVGFVSQCILTPSLSYIFKNLFSNLKDKCGFDLEDIRTRWISKQCPGPNGGFNIVIADFVDLSDNLFAKTVINLNLKLLNVQNLKPCYPILTIVNEANNKY
ncbi:PI-PLC X domain-containing protein 2 isoform X3 [Cylas formicarius]|uniref:PI-PLC X domain-containing protein 2 isoform X3 n=1 Tax=Cylas formicarius TaxID=197179 RepID=UPI002958A66A|nr:PI-PLC X domain-containing protein 2 isoform X3 [Cylas formicarius]